MAVTKALNIHLALDLIDYSDVIFFGTSVKPLTQLNMNMNLSLGHLKFSQNPKMLSKSFACLQRYKLLLNLNASKRFRINVSL